MPYQKKSRIKPYPDWNSPEGKAFREWAIEEYRVSIRLAYGSIVQSDPVSAFSVILEKTASPLVYLWERWVNVDNSDYVLRDKKLELIRKHTPEEARQEAERVREELAETPLPERDKTHINTVSDRGLRGRIRYKTISGNEVAVG